MEAIYDEMCARNARLVAEHDLAYDPHLCDTPDRRYCLAVYGKFDPVQTRLYPRFFSLYRLLRAHAPQVVPYTLLGGLRAESGTLHTTLLQLVGFAAFGQQRANDEVIYRTVLAELQGDLLPLRIEFRRLVLTRNSLIALGYPNKDVNAWREQFRQHVRERGGRLWEPYKADIVHCTLARFAGPVTTASLQLPPATTEESILTTTLSHLTLGRGTWRLNDDD